MTTRATDNKVGLEVPDESASPRLVVLWICLAAVPMAFDFRESGVLVGGCCVLPIRETSAHTPLYPSSRRSYFKT